MMAIKSFWELHSHSL